MLHAVALTPFPATCNTLMSDVAQEHTYILLPLKRQHASLPCATLDSNCSFEKLKYDKQFVSSVQGQMACKLKQAQVSLAIFPLLSLP